MSDRTAPTRPSPPGRTARRVAMAAPAFLALLLVISGGAFAVGAHGLTALAAAPVAIAHAPAAATAAPTSHGHAASHSFGPPPVASGRGTFWVNQPVPFGTPATLSGTPTNSSNDASINYTSTGVLALAYTVFTNQTSCANASGVAQTEIGFTESSNSGSTWSTPTVLSNTDCAHTNWYASAWEPSLTSLSNGTLVLAYIQYNLTSFTYAPGQLWGTYGTWNTNASRLVVQESYNNGASWTAAQTLNASVNWNLSKHNWLPERPWATATGNTVYIAWMNYTMAPGTNYSSFPYTATGSSQVHLLVSTNGGTAWGSRIDLAVTHAKNDSSAMNPNLLVDPSGKLYLAYVTNISYAYGVSCGGTSCYYYGFEANVEVATSTNNGTTFAYHDAANGIYAVCPQCPTPTYPFPAFMDPSPQMAYNPVSSQVYMVYSSYGIQPVCYSYGCYNNTNEMDFLLNSSNGGASWSTPHVVDRAFFSEGGGFYYVYQPSISVGAGGVLHLSTTFNPGQGNAYCFSPPYQCGQFEVYANSTDNGLTFTNVSVVWLNSTADPYSPTGEYSTMVSQGATAWIAWSHQWCPMFYYCGLPSTLGWGQVTVTHLFDQTGVTLTFQEKGVNVGTSWGINVQGNVRNGTAPTNLAISGVPTGVAITWSIGSISAGYGVQYGSAGSPTPPATFTANATIYENFSEQVLVNITSNPYFPACTPGFYYYGVYCWDYSYSPLLNYNITPAPAPQWVVPGASTLTASVNLSGLYGCSGTYYYCAWLNLTFLSWTGTGAGSVNTSTTSVSVSAKGPVNETANFRIVGVCTDYYYQTPPLQCIQENASLYFHESGLPSGTGWNVTASGWLNHTATGGSTTPWLSIANNLTIGITSFSIWTIPDGVTGLYWVGTPNPASPVEIPGVRVVQVNFTAVLPSSASFGLTFQEVGLPANSPWSVGVNGVTYGIQNTSWQSSVAGGSLSIDASSVYFTNGTSYYPSQVTWSPYVVGASWVNYTTLPAAATVNGPGIVTVTYSPEYWVQVTNSTGGSATPSSQWVHSGSRVQLNETPSAGYYFVGWTGSGSGAISTAVANPRVSPGGPVTELATFSPIGAPHWNVTVQAIGLPAGVSFAVTLGNLSYSGGATFAVAGLSTGSYALSVPYAYENSSLLTRFAPTGTVTSFTSTSSGAFLINQNGWINVTFSTQYLVTVSATGPGTVSPVPGTYWVGAGSAFPLTATPSSHYQLSGWNGSGTGSVSGTGLSISPMVNSPLWETALFIWKPNTIPAVYTLTVTQTGLPTGTAWSVSTGTTGSAGAGASLVIGGLNGTYTVTIPTLYGAGGTTRYVPSNTTWSQTVDGNKTASVTFTTQYWVGVTGSSGGAVTGGGWVNAGSTVTFGATAANASWTFLYWNSSSGYTGTNPSNTVSVTGPFNESATFAPVYQSHSSGSQTAGQSTAFGLLAVLLVVGLVIGLLVGRRRPPQPMVYATPVGAQSSGPEPEGGPTEVAAPGSAVYDESVP